MTTMFASASCFAFLSVHDDKGVFTYIDGDDMDSLEAIEALGGDPGFWDPPEESSLKKKEGVGAERDSKEDLKLDDFAIPTFMKDGGGGEEIEWSPTMGLGPKPDKPVEVDKMEEGWEWDGIVDEGAYFD
ncbi:hypothetical protein TrRE_jg7145 [Triparma retinervis]|uniref:Uncharacterized protein n=1 Tax=Triparma retinervis TaxID=2557542 RepID=A0A9W7G7Y1_9STRA|nr:hypothetical protein TrRE_jg7145 [Triparma retinervis]